MNLKVFLILIFFILIKSSQLLANEEFKIILKVENEIITNIDLINEKNYFGITCVRFKTTRIISPSVKHYRWIYYCRNKALNYHVIQSNAFLIMNIYDINCMLGSIFAYLQHICKT